MKSNVFEKVDKNQINIATFFKKVVEKAQRILYNLYSIVEKTIYIKNTFSYNIIAKSILRNKIA